MLMLASWASTSLGWLHVTGGRTVYAYRVTLQNARTQDIMTNRVCCKPKDRVLECRYQNLTQHLSSAEIACPTHPCHQKKVQEIKGPPYPQQIGVQDI